MFSTDIRGFWLAQLCFHLIFLHVVTGLSFRTCPPTETAVVPSGSAKASVVWVPPVVNGNGVNIAVSHDHNPGDLFPIGNTTVTYTALNFTETSVLDKAVCSFLITVLDLTPPLIQCPYPITLNIPSGHSNISINWAPAAAYDNSGTLVVTSTHQPGDLFSVGNTQVTYTARDPSGNQVSCSFNVSLHLIEHSTTLHKTHPTTLHKTNKATAKTNKATATTTSHTALPHHATNQKIQKPTEPNKSTQFNHLTPLWKGKVGKTPLNEILHGKKPADDSTSDSHKSAFDNPTMQHVNLFVHRNMQTIEIACITFVSLVMVALIILGAYYNKELLQALRLRHERRRTPFPSTSWEQCPQMDGMNDPLLNQEYMDYPKNRAPSPEKPLLQPGEVLPLLINGNKKGAAKQK